MQVIKFKEKIMMKVIVIMLAITEIIIMIYVIIIEVDMVIENSRNCLTELIEPIKYFSHPFDHYQCLNG